MSSPTEEAVDKLYHQAAEIVGNAGTQGGGQQVSHAYQMFSGFAHYGEQFALGLFPLALVLLILHEHYQAATTGSPYRIAHVLVRTGVVAALLLGFGKVCSLITYAAGGHGGWMSYDQVLATISTSTQGLGSAWSNYTGGDAGLNGDTLSAVFKMLPILIVWGIVVCALLFAYVAGVLLSLTQAVLLAILLAVGKTCITVSLVPGVGLGSSWARSLAKVAAWSTIAGVITSLMIGATPNLQRMIWREEYVALFKTAGQFVVLGACTFAVPMITERIFSGGAPHVMSAWRAGREGWQGLRMVVSPAAKAASSTSRAAGRAAGADAPSGSDDMGGASARVFSAQSGDAAAAARPHKVAPSRLREGLATIGALAAAPLAVAARSVLGREPGADPVAGRLGRRGSVTATNDSTAPSSSKDVALGRLPAAGGPQAETRVARAVPGREADPRGTEHREVPSADPGWSPSEGRALRAAYPDLAFDGKNPSPLEKEIYRTLTSQTRFAGWREGLQAHRDFGDARSAAQRQLAGSDAGTERGSRTVAGELVARPSASGGASASSPTRMAGSAWTETPTDPGRFSAARSSPPPTPVVDVNPRLVEASARPGARPAHESPTFAASEGTTRAPHVVRRNPITEETPPPSVRGGDDEEDV